MERTMFLNVVNKRTHIAKPGTVDVYCGRGSVLGNPYSHKEGTKAEFVMRSREATINAYRHYFAEQVYNNVDFVNELRRIYRLALKSEVNLVCYCYPLDCHCNIVRGFLLSF